MQGYPALTGYSFASSPGQTTPIDSVTVSDGTQLMPNPGVATVRLAPRAIAQFGIEATVTAGHAAQTISEFRITMPDESGTVGVSVTPGLPASAADNGAIPLGITAYGLASSTATFSQSSPAPTPTTGDPRTSAASPSGSNAAIAPCVAGDLAITTGRVDSGAGQRDLPITLTNTLGPTCTVSGFPQDLTAYSTTTGDGPISVNPTHGAGTAQTITLIKGASASFVFHTTIGYDTTPVTIQLLRFQLPGSPGQVQMEIGSGGMAANGPSGQPIPVDASALQPGTGS